MMKNFLLSRNIIFIVTVFAVMVAGFRVYSVLAATPQYKTVEVKKTTVTHQISASGEIKSENEVELKFSVSGKLTYLAVKKNSRINKWGYIGSLDKQELRKKMDKSLRDYAKERNDFEQDNRVTYKDQVFTDTLKRILEKNQWDLDKAVIDVELADWANKNADLSSPISGVVTKVHTQEGTSIIGGTTPIVTIADPENLSFVARIGESDVVGVKVGQAATVTLDAFEAKDFSGVVSEIDYAATVTNGGKFYLAKIKLDETDGVKLDMSGEADIVTQSSQNVIAIPKEAVSTGNGKNYVEVLENGKPRKKEISIGQKAVNGHIEILSGISEGEKVIIPATSK